MNEQPMPVPQPGLLNGAAGEPARPVEELPESKSLLAAPEEGEGLIGSQEAPMSEDEIQEAYDMAVSIMTKALYAKGGVDRLLKYFTSPVGTIQQKIVETVKSMVVELDSRADFPEEVIVPAALEILGEVVEVCVKARLMKEDQKSVEALGSMLTAMLFDEYGVTQEQADEARGGVDPASLEGEQLEMGATEEMPDEPLPPAGPKPLIESEMRA